MFEIKNKKMTGTASSRGMSVFDVDIHRNQEWLRRRKLRLEQVRRQSNEIARALRQKVINEEKARLDEYDRISEAKFKDWKAEKIDELERKFRYALEEFGKGYQLAEEEPDPEEVIEDRYKVNLAKAQKRGEIAKQEELRRKKIAEEQKMSLIQRKKLVRKKEDLRSALIHSLPNKRHILDAQKGFEEKSPPERVPLTPQKKKATGQKKENDEGFPKKEGRVKGRRKKVTAQKSCMCKKKTKASELGPHKGSDTIWINLSEIQNSSTGDSGVRPTSTKSSVTNDRSQKEKPESVVEFYDFSSRYYRKSFREFPHLVQRIHPQSEMLNANDLAKIEDEKEKAEARKKMEADTISQERGMEALRREKITQDYNNLIAKLEELNKKEKLLKAQQRNLPNFLHMTDERLSERLKAKQRLMDSKFENIYYEVMSQMPRAEPPRAKPFCREGGGDFAESDDGGSTRSSGPPARLKTNSPVTSDGEPRAESSTEETTRKPKKTKRKRQLLLDIDKTLKEGRELREAVSRNRDSASADGGGENVKEISNSDSEVVQVSVMEVFPCKDEGKTMRCKESQTEDIKGEEAGSLDGKDFSKLGEDSLPVSTSTSYKSPPSVIRSYRLRQFLEYLEGVTEVEDDGFMQKGPNRNRKVDKLLQDLFQKNRHDNKPGEKEEKSRASPTLEYYIEKLLNMSRECVADLSVSSENLSTPNITDLDIRELKAPEPVYSCQNCTNGEDLIRKCRLDRADRLEETIKDWKRILENNSERPSEVEDVPDCPQAEPGRKEATSRGKPEKLACVMYSPKLCTRYEEITKKCSERISELSNMLDKVRKDKEKLLSSTSGDSSLSLNKGEGNSEVDEEEEGEPLERCMASVEEPRGSLVDGFLNRFSLSKPRRETVSTTAVADSQSAEDLEESLESWPDVMDELLKRKILTSPFKWSDGEYSTELSPVSDSHTKPSSIETVIGNFRKEISKIKPSALSDSFPQQDSFLKSSCLDEKTQESFASMKKRTSSRRSTTEVAFFQEESSMESINQALTTLGLNWAKSFLRKNEESRAISSSSNSEGKCSGDEADGFP